MRIAVVGQRWNPNYLDKYRGGGEKIESDHVRLLSEAGHEVHFLTNDDSEARPGNVVTHFVGASKFSLKGGRMPGKRSNIVRDRVLAIDPDVVLIHDNDNPTLNTKLAYQKPCVAIVHSSVAIAGGISTFNYLASLWLLASRGHSVLCVSETSRKEWEAYIQKNKEYILREEILPEEALEPNAVFTGYLHNPVVWEKPVLRETTNGYCTLGRLIRQKRHHVGLGATDDLTLYCPMPYTGNPESAKILDKLEKKFGEHRIRKGVPYARLMGIVAESKALLSFSIESFGLTGMEANSFGVPVILQHPTKEHALEEACAPSKEHGSLVRVTEENLQEFLRDFKPYPKDQRQAILDATWDYYGVEAATKRLENSLHFAIEKATRYKEGERDAVVDDVFSLLGGAV